MASTPTAMARLIFHRPLRPLRLREFPHPQSPGYNNAKGNGTYQQIVNAANLSEGMHYLTVRAFRHRATAQRIFTDLKKVIYVDRLKPVSRHRSFDARRRGR